MRILLQQLGNLIPRQRIEARLRVQRGEAKVGERLIRVSRQSLEVNLDCLFQAAKDAKYHTLNSEVSVWIKRAVPHGFFDKAERFLGTIRIGQNDREPDKRLRHVGTEFNRFPALGLRFVVSSLK